MGRRLAAIFADGYVDDVVRLGRVHETVARATARRQTGDGRVHRAGRQGEIRAEDTASGTYGPGKATRTAPVADQMDRRYMPAVVPGKLTDGSTKCRFLISTVSVYQVRHFKSENSSVHNSSDCKVH